MTRLKNWLPLFPIFLVSCSSAPTYNKPEAPKVAQRPWQRVALRGVVQTSLNAFGTKIVIRAWPSKENPHANSALLDAVTEIQRIDHMTNPQFGNSEITKVNVSSWDGPVPISDELALILQDCGRMYDLSEGKFDILYVPYKTEQNFTDDDINKIATWDTQPKLSPNPIKIMGAQGLIIDQNPTRVRRYNRRQQINLNGMIRGYAIDKVTHLLADQKLAGFAIIAEGLIGAAGIALKDPGIMCVEDPQNLGKCIRALKATDPTRAFFIGTSPSNERRGQMYDPNSTWSYRSGGVIVAGPSAKWVQFATTYGAIADEGRLNTLFDKKNGLNLSGIYFDQNDKNQIVGTLAPYADVIPVPAPRVAAPAAAPKTAASPAPQ